MEQCCVNCLMPVAGIGSTRVICKCGWLEDYLICEYCSKRIEKRGWAGFGMQRVPDPIIVNNMVSPIGIRLMVAVTT